MTAAGHKSLRKKVRELEDLLEESKRAITYYQRISEESGKRRLREISQLSRLIEERRKSEEAISNAKEEWERTFDAVPDLIMILDGNFRIVKANRAMADTLGLAPDELTGLLCYEHVHGLDHPPLFCPHQRMLEDEKPHTVEVTESRLKGVFLVSVSPLRDRKGRVTGAVHVARDITKRKRAEELIQKANQDLERKVAERTHELYIMNEKLRHEIEERKQTEKKIRETEQDLKQQTEHLERTNTALRVLIEHRDEEKRQLQANILANVEKLIFPYIEQLEVRATERDVKSYLSIIRTNLEDLISPFSSQLSSTDLRLTPAQLQVADLVRQGLTNKEIALHLNVSVDAVGFHRKNIRRKLGLIYKKINLRTYLQQIS
ncbi:MAG: hypothetical protein DRH37_06050 [Deltaproteobacteria bacterium]|nr:MAG: hypothetical protein DRH37_06050 [Deltaproteobacteria bacterium]